MHKDLTVAAGKEKEREASNPSRILHSQFFSIFLEGKSIEPVGESKSDYEIVCEVAKKLGLHAKYTKGKTIEEWIKYGYENSNIQRLVSWEKLRKRNTTLSRPRQIGKRTRLA